MFITGTKQQTVVTFRTERITQIETSTDQSDWTNLGNFEENQDVTIAYDNGIPFFVRATLTLG